MRIWKKYIFLIFVVSVVKLLLVSVFLHQGRLFWHACHRQLLQNVGLVNRNKTRTWKQPKLLGSEICNNFQLCSRWVRHDTSWHDTYHVFSFNPFYIAGAPGFSERLKYVLGEPLMFWIIFAFIQAKIVLSKVEDIRVTDNRGKCGGYHDFLVLTVQKFWQ